MNHHDHTGLHKHIDIYCERLDPSFWAEPINAITNGAFFIGGFFALMLARKENALDWRSGLLIALIFGMGIGSTLFHTFAQLWAMLADILPILLYQMAFIVLYMRYVIGAKWRYAFGLLIPFIALMQGAMQLPREWLNGSMEYGPALVFVTVLGIWHWRNAARDHWALLAAAGVFTISLTFRSIDMAVCAALPIGTHFLWHCLNALVLYLTARGFIKNAR